MRGFARKDGVSPSRVILDTRPKPRAYGVRAVPSRVVSLVSTIACLLVLGTPAPAPAAGATTVDATRTPWIVSLRPHRNLWELGGFVGVLVPPSRHDLYDLDTAPQRALGRAGPSTGLRAGYFPIGWVGVEGEADGTWTRVRADDEPVFVWGLRASGVVQLPLYRVVPFVLGGYGLMGSRSTLDAVGSDIDPTGHLGAGVKLYLTRAIALRVDGRWLLGAAAARRRTVSHWGSVTFGVSVTLGPGRAGSG